MAPTAYLLLGMVQRGFRTGYDIKQLVDKSTRFFWAASYGQIYPELKKLEEAGLLRGEAAGQGGRQRRAYELTEAGEDALREWLTAPEEPVFEMRDMTLLKLFFADGLEPAERSELARAARLRHEGVVAALEDVARGGPAEGSMPHAVLTFGLDCHRDWANRYGELERRLKETD